MHPGHTAHVELSRLSPYEWRYRQRRARCSITGDVVGTTCARNMLCAAVSPLVALLANPTSLGPPLHFPCALLLYVAFQVIYAPCLELIRCRSAFPLCSEFITPHYIPCWIRAVQKLQSRTPWPLGILQGLSNICRVAYFMAWMKSRQIFRNGVCMVCTSRT